MIEEHLNLPAGDDPPAAEADFTLTFPVKEYGYDYVGLVYTADGTEREAILLTPEEFQRVTKLFLRFDEKVKEEEKHSCPRCGSENWTYIDYGGCSECRPHEERDE